MTSTERVPQHREIQKDIWLSVLVAFAIGIGLGALLSEDALLANEATRLETLAWIGLPGHLFLSVIKFIVAPLIFSSICLAIAAPSELPDPGKLTLKVFAVFVFTTLAATMVGLSLAHLFQPGHAIDSSLVESAASFEAGDAITAISSEIGWLPQAFIDLVPSDLTSAFADGHMLQVLVAALIIGFALRRLAGTKAAQHAVTGLRIVQSVSMEVVRFAIHFTPIAVAALIAEVSAKFGLDVVFGVVTYVLTVLAGLAVLLLLYAALIMLLAQRSPLEVFPAFRNVMLLGFATSSSAAVMPVTMETAEQRLGVPSSIVKFVVPLGATINMDGTALYQSVATVFLAQVFGLELSLVQLATVSLMATVASIGAPGAPGVGILILASILAQVGIPVEGIALILGVDRLLDMCRTAVNVASDLTTCLIVSRTPLGPLYAR